MTTEERELRLPRFRLVTLLLLVGTIAVAAGWLVDRSRLTERLRQSQVEIKVKQEQLGDLQHRLSLQYGAVQTIYWWASADEFVKMLTATSDDEKFYDMAPSLASAEDEVFRKSIEQLTMLLNAPEERTRSRAVVTLRFMREKRPDRLAEHAAAIMQNLIPLLDDSSLTVIGETIVTLRSFGPTAQDAVAPLTKRMKDDSEWYAPDAAIAIAEIDPEIDIGPRLTELVQTKHPNWYQAAFNLPRYVEPEIARDVLTKVYHGAQDESERNAVVQCLNQIPRKSEQ